MAAPEGNDNASRGKEFRAALQRALAKRSNGAGWRQALDKIADKLCGEAENGVQWATQEIANRLDGKPVEHLEVKRGVESIGDEELAAAIVALQSIIAAQRAESGAAETDGSAQTH